MNETEGYIRHKWENLKIGNKENKANQEVNR